MSMASCFRVSHSYLNSLWRSCCHRPGGERLLIPQLMSGFSPCFSISSSSSRKGYCKLSDGLKTELPRLVTHAATLHGNLVGSAEIERVVSGGNFVNLDNRDEVKGGTVSGSNGRVMLIDGTSIIYRAYYKLLARLERDNLPNADGNGDWILNVLELVPSHVAVVFDHDGIPFGHTSVPSRENYNGKGMNFRHTLYPAYKAHRSPTPDTVIQGLQFLKASIKAMSIQVIEVPGVEADDVIGTLAVNSVANGFKVRIVSPDKDFFQIISPALRLLRIASRGSEMVSFGVEEFSKRYGDLKPSQFVDMLSLTGDKSDNIPGTLENLLECVDQVAEERIKKALRLNADKAMLSKNLVTLRADLPSYMVPYTTSDLLFKKPTDDGEKFRNLLRAISAYAEGHSADYLIRRSDFLWKKL
ncbi:hypothetical protein C5167_025865 [Papaver somniferum]|uniref:5'-3' exonuclease domain-containing protein n=1 Tax=Papaver somniferum TaxID=3469 RepID=A0A4Y7JWE7_PAPSO|nr:hypothetical protein C5167_025865 [Papaver somniferum]